MKQLKLSLFILLVFGMFAPTAVAQTKLQKEYSTAMVSELHQGKYNFNPNATRKLSQKDVISLIEENEHLSAGLREQLTAELGLDQSIINWRAIITEFEQECGKIQAITISTEDDDGIMSGVVTVHLPMDNPCSKLIDRLAERLYGGLLGGDAKITRCEANQCVSIPTSTAAKRCVKVVTLVSEGISCYTPFNTCESNQDCPQDGKDYTVEFFETMFMTGK